MMREVNLPFADLGGAKFLLMVGVAMFAHIFILAVMHFSPSVSIDEIKVKPIQFRIGAGGVLAPEVSDIADKQEVPAPKPVQKTRLRQTKKLKPAEKVKPFEQAPAVKVKQPKRVSITAEAASEVPAGQRRIPTGNIAARLSPAEIAATKNSRQQGLPTLGSLFDNVEREAKSRNGAAAVGKSQQVTSRLSRQLASPGSAGVGANNSPEIEAIRLRYEQQISSWVAQQRYYPKAAEGRSGRAIVRVRVDRQGYVRYYKVEDTSGYAVFDSAAIDMIRRANPMPSAPNNYPAGNLIEFLIPITFKP